MDEKIYNGLPVLSFTYLRVDQLPLLESMFSLGIDSVKELNDRYTLIHHHDHPLYHDCPIYQIPYNDINDGYLKMFYDEFVNKYGQDCVDMIIPKNEDVIRKNISNVIKFAFEKVYQVDKIKVEFWQSHPTTEKISIPNIIYSVLYENFKIIDRLDIGLRVVFTIELLNPINHIDSNNDTNET